MINTLASQNRDNKIFNIKLSDRLVDVIKSRIINNELSPGDKISIKNLTYEFQTSTTPIRDALNTLASQGMITISPRVGYFVKSFSKKEVDDIFYVRAKLESAILESVFSDISEGDLKLWMSIDEKYSKEKLSKEEIDKFSLEESIHLLLCKKCKNDYLTDVYINFFEKVLLISSVIAHRYPSYTDHSDILSAISTGNLETAKKALSQHLDLARRSIHENLQ